MKLNAEVPGIESLDEGNITAYNKTTSGLVRECGREKERPWAEE